VDGRITVFPRDGQEIFHAVVKLLDEQRVRVDELQLERGRLEDVFRQVTSGSGDTAAAA